MIAEIKNPGILSQLQDAGRYGYHRLGLTSGGAMDPFAFCLANLLCDNAPTATAIEVAVGGLALEFRGSTRVAVAGAEGDVWINEQPVQRWRTHAIASGDQLKLGYARRGVRSYVAISGGFTVEPWLGSTSTVVREGVGGLDGRALQTGDLLPFGEDSGHDLWQLPAAQRPHYSNRASLRLIPGYQNAHFPREQQQLFFQSTFEVSDLCDRMGYRLNGPAIHGNVQGILSEGICLGAVQIPPDGQPIVLMHDHQTIGGYPKIGSVLSLDLARLAQLKAGDKINFAAITQANARQALQLTRDYFTNLQLEAVDDD